MHQLILALERIEHPRVALIGDFMLDRYVYGDTDRISPDSLSPEEGVEMVKSEADYGEEWMANSLEDSFDALEGTDG